MQPTSFCGTTFACCFLILICFLALPLHAEKTLGVDSTAARFSPGLWVGDAGRGGRIYRRTWNVGAWCEWRWTTTSAHPTATLLMTNQTPQSAIVYFLDGAMSEEILVPASGGIPLNGLTQRGEHSLIVYNAKSHDGDRWNQTNSFTVAGLSVDDDGSALPAALSRPWILIVGDSITEGIGCKNSLGDYAFLVGHGLGFRGYDTSVSACGWSGWIHPGDGMKDVPGFYSVHGGVYSEADSRWNKIDAHTSLLDADGHISANGETGQEPAAIVFNYMVNECLHGVDVHDAQLSVTRCLAGLRKAAPNTLILILIPPGLQDAVVYPKGAPYVGALRDAVAEYQKSNTADRKTVLVDLGPDVAHALASKPYGGGVHPNDAGHAYQAPIIIQAILKYLTP